MRQTNGRTRVKDLKDQTGERGPRAVLYCALCGAEYSANRGDYFMEDPEHAFKCCNGLKMRRVMKRTVYQEV